MGLRATLTYRDEFGMDVELASTIDDIVMSTVKDAALRMAELKIAHNIGDEVHEKKYRLEYDKLKELLDFVLPVVPRRRSRR